MSEAAPTIDARPVEEVLQQHLEHVPPHIAEELGELSLRLSHVDMYEQTEQTTASGHVYTDTNFERDITSPDHDASSLQAEAVEAAHAGKERVGHLLAGSAELLGQAHSKLEEGGFSFIASETESEAQRDQRQAHEKQALYDTAYSLAIEKAAALREAGDSQGASDLLESVIILRDVREKDNPFPDRKVFRDVVRAGLSDELLTACQETQDIYVGTAGHKLGKNINDVSSLLSMATGKSIDYGFEVSERPFSFDSFTGIQDDDAADLLAVLGMPDAPLKLSDIPNTGLVNLQEIKKVESLPPDQQQETLNTMYQVVETLNPMKISSMTGGSVSAMLDLCRTTDKPQAVANIMRLTGLNEYQAKTLFATYEKGENGMLNKMGTVDTTKTEQFEQLFADHPEDAQLVVSAIMENNLMLERFKGLNPETVSESLQILRSHDMLSDSLVLQVAFGVSPERINDFVSIVESSSQTLSALPQELLSMLDVSDVNNVISELERLAELHKDTDEVGEQLLDKVTLIQVRDLYKKLYSEVEYPITKETTPKAALADLPFLEKRLQASGLSEELILDMFASWNTYSAVNIHYYNNRSRIEKGAQLEDGDISRIALDQSEAFMAQIRGLEQSIEVLGLEGTQEIIDTFGIYNFSRHSVESLRDQLERWKAGEPIKTVVVDARADWNSFTSKGTVFESEVGDGVFYFEANSGTEAARIAVNVGQHERSSGREPDVSRFVIHAHGNPEGMVMGVNRELINIDGYLEAMQKAQKIRETESNDFKRHLGPNFEVILQSCSTAGEIAGSKNIAQMISETHGTKVQASDVTIYGVKILNDGSVQFSSNDGDGTPIVYKPKNVTSDAAAVTPVPPAVK